MKKILTGLKPTGDLTLGNYIGSIKQMINLEDKYESYLFVADLHALTVPNDPQSPFVTSGVRLGTAAITSRGLKVEDMDKVAEAISLAIKNEADKAKEIVEELTKKYPLYDEVN